jgi:hypothetical protein
MTTAMVTMSMLTMVAITTVVRKVVTAGICHRVHVREGSTGGILSLVP